MQQFLCFRKSLFKKERIEKRMKKFLILLSLIILMPLKIDALSIDLHSTHVYIYDLKDEKMLYQKGDEEENVRIASLTKIMTTI
ncbi:MAG TPA: hypothetical protein DCY94_03690 [Firmicutes bacterium]|nr:hypothetical protein [Bacillota bacterium]